MSNIQRCSNSIFEHKRFPNFSSLRQETFRVNINFKEERRSPLPISKSESFEKLSFVNLAVTYIHSEKSWSATLNFARNALDREREKPLENYLKRVLPLSPPPLFRESIDRTREPFSFQFSLPKIMGAGITMTIPDNDARITNKNKTIIERQGGRRRHLLVNRRPPPPGIALPAR